MDRCTPCKNSNSMCFKLDDHPRCFYCTRKGVKECDAPLTSKNVTLAIAECKRLCESVNQKGEDIVKMLLALSEDDIEWRQQQSELDDLMKKLNKMNSEGFGPLDEPDNVDPTRNDSSPTEGPDDTKVE
ncbi:hypothetical protein H2204_001261 [Knufia peltigerae]|uniref:Uncharacterized protein n=1 Tax=Knufia peltigerae TaxID=1002370 RepID=A0AA38YD89_9EURO|nr:hypothetical protein H2204_001261 [Knufia peltigerae]